MSKFDDVFSKILSEAEGDGEVGSTFEALLDDIRSAEVLGKPDRREKIAEFIKEIKDSKLADLGKLQIKLADVAKDATLADKLEEIFASLKGMDAKLLADLEKLSARLGQLIQTAKFDSPDNKKRFIDSVKMAFANVNDADLEKLYALEAKLIKVMRAV